MACLLILAQLVEHCSTNAEAMGLNLVEALKIVFPGLKIYNCLNCNNNDHL